MTLRQNFQKTYCNSPAAMQAFMAVSSHVRNNSPLPARLRELAILQVGRSAQSPYVFTHHVKAALEAGITTEDLQAVGAVAPALPSDATDRAVVELARAMTTGEIVPDETFATVRQALGDAVTMDLLFVITHYIGMATLLRTLAIELEESYKQYLPYASFVSELRCPI